MFNFLQLKRTTCRQKISKNSNVSTTSAEYSDYVVSHLTLKVEDTQHFSLSHFSHLFFGSSSLLSQYITCKFAMMLINRFIPTKCFFATVLFEYLGVKELVNVDNACCNHMEREMFLNTLKNVGETMNHTGAVALEGDSTWWMYSRGVTVSNLLAKHEAHLTYGFIRLTDKKQDSVFEKQQRHINDRFASLTLLTIKRDRLLFQIFRDKSLDPVFGLFFKHISHLKEINIKNCANLLDAHLRAISDNCKQLETLRLGSCIAHQRSDDEMAWVEQGRECTVLEMCNLFDQCVCLRTFSINMINAAPVVMMPNLLGKMHSLTDLQIKNSKWLHLRKFAENLEKCTNLKHLKLSCSCAFVNAQDCKAITPETEARLRVALPQLGEEPIFVENEVDTPPVADEV